MSLEILISNRVRRAPTMRLRCLSLAEFEDYLFDSRNETPTVISFDERLPGDVVVGVKELLASYSRTKDILVRRIDAVTLRPVDLPAAELACCR